MTFPTAAATITRRKSFGTCAMALPSSFVRFRNRRIPPTREILASNLRSRKWDCGCCTAQERPASRACFRNDRFAARLRARASAHLLQLLEDSRVLECRHVLLDLLALRDRAQQPPHDLARARLGQVVAEADVLGLGNGADLLADPVAQLLGDFQRL